jgi:hypothetical protein
MATDVAEIWRDCFRNWPTELVRRGVLVTTLNEQIPFENFSAGENMLLVERRAPDTVGARTVLTPYQNIAALKIVDVVKAKMFSQLGLAPAPPAK